MKLLRTTAREVIGLFLDDEFLAAAALVIVCVAAVFVKGLGVAPLVAGGVLLGGCVAALLASVLRAAQGIKAMEAQEAAVAGD